MKLELLTLIIVGGLLFNTYYNNKYTKLILSYKKYIQMATIIIIAFSVYLLIKRKPDKSTKLLMYANNLVKYMPINKQSASLITPLFDFTTIGENPGGFMGSTNQTLTGKTCGTAPMNWSQHLNQKPARITKRSVSETKKKYVASNQDWKCGNCAKQLNAWFEVDHKIRLDQGGSNDVTNLVALCRECHGGKTAMENM